MKLKDNNYVMRDLELNSLEIDLNGESDDIFIMAASFEHRDVAISGSLRPGYKCGNCIVYYNEDNSQYEGNLKTIVDNMNGVSVNGVKQIAGSHRDSHKKNQAMIEIAEFCKNNKSDGVTNIAIDITGFTKIDLIVLLDFIESYVNDVNIKILYVSPEKHGDWLSKGHAGICNIPGFCGNYDVLKKTALIILSGFEKNRSKNLIEEYEPHKVFLGLSNPAVQEQFGIINENIHAELLDYINVSKFNFSAREISECYKTLYELVKSLIDEYNVVIAPLCTKLSALACYKVAKKFPEVQLVYCFPHEYNYVDYSEGMSKLIIEYLTDD